jgi:flagellum-specific ATP synthase
LKENEVLIRIGAYAKGSDMELDEAISKKDDMQDFLSQSATYQSNYQESVDTLIKLMSTSTDVL